MLIGKRLCGNNKALLGWPLFLREVYFPILIYEPNGWERSLPVRKVESVVTTYVTIRKEGVPVREEEIHASVAIKFSKPLFQPAKIGEGNCLFLHPVKKQTKGPFRVGIPLGYKPSGVRKLTQCSINRPHPLQMIPQHRRAINGTAEKPFWP